MTFHPMKTAINSQLLRFDKCTLGYHKYFITGGHFYILFVALFLKNTFNTIFPLQMSQSVWKKKLFWKNVARYH